MSDIKLFHLAEGDYLHLDLAQLNLLSTFARDVSQRGHWVTGDLELVITSANDLNLAKPAIRMAYEGRRVIGSKEG